MNILTAEISSRERQRILAEILKVAHFYGYTPPTKNLEAWLND
jgi:hypothetical protein